uniref:Uncharacterized protein n=1 Tax=Cacopsylla melanoneura TaxID=428564 RepID=A0A8D8QPH6_9HEMI
MVIITIGYFRTTGNFSIPVSSFKRQSDNRNKSFLLNLKKLGPKAPKTYPRAPQNLSFGKLLFHIRIRMEIFHSIIRKEPLHLTYTVQFVLQQTFQLFRYRGHDHVFNGKL